MRSILTICVLLFTVTIHAQVVREQLCERPDFGGSDASRSALMWRWQKAAKHNYVTDYNADLKHDFAKGADFGWLKDNTLVIGQFDQTKRQLACIAKPYDLYTDNEQEIALELITPSNSVCSAR